ncbi:Hsp90 family chaperone protein [Moritella viscosa]
MTDTVNTETHGFQAEVKQLLKLMIHSLYSNKEIFLRELVSNAADAADKLRFKALSDNSLYGNDGELRVRVSLDKTARTITIADNGIGMSREDVISHLGTIARSGTSEFFENLSGDQAKDSQLIGQFGVGFYSGFIVADMMTVNTRAAGAAADQAVQWESEGEGDYRLADITKESRGTEIILHLREGEDDLLDEWKLRQIVNKYSDHISIPVEMWKEEQPESEGPDGEKTPAVPGEWESVGFDKYIENMQEGQDKIYYITADNYTTAVNSAYLEIFKKKGIEVLLLTDRIDEWLLSHLTDFDSKQLVSVTKGDLDLGALDDEDAKKAKEEATEEFASFIERVKTTLGEKVADVRLTHRLTETPSCVVTNENGMSSQMIKLMESAGQAVPSQKYIFELNPEHEMIKRVADEADETVFTDWVQLLLEQAQLTERGSLDDPAAFIARMNRLIG